MNRWLQLMLLMPEDEFITYKALSEELGISVRTVYDDISRLNEMVLEHGAQLVARPHHGVTLDVYDRALFLRFLDALGSGNTILGDTSEARIGKIIRTLLGSPAPCKGDNLCEALHISRSTLKKDLHGVRALLDSAAHMAVRSLPMRPAISRCIFMSLLSACVHSEKNASLSFAAREKERQCCSPTPSKRTTENISR